MSAHTPGPWSWSGGATVFSRAGSFGPCPIASVHPHAGIVQSEANARLIAAAPEMLDALREAHSALGTLWAIADALCSGAGIEKGYAQKVATEVRAAGGAALAAIEKAQFVNVADAEGGAR